MTLLKFPNELLKLLYLVYFKPFSLRDYLYEVDLSLGENPSLGNLWKVSKRNPTARSLLLLVICSIFIVPWLSSNLILLLFQLGDADINWTQYDILAFTLLAAIVSQISISASIALNCGLVIYYVTHGLAHGTLFECLSQSFLIYFVSDVFLDFKYFRSRFLPSTIGAAIVIAATNSIYFYFSFGSELSLLNYVLISLTVYIVVACRVPLYIVESIFSWILSAKLEANSKSPLWHLSPIVWDEMILLPLLELDTHLIVVAKKDRAIGLEAITFVASSLSQTWASKSAVLHLMVNDIKDSRDLDTIADFPISLGWLSEDNRADFKSFLLSLNEISQHARAALESETHYNHQEQLRLGLNLIENMLSGLATDTDWRDGKLLISALEAWRQVFSQEYEISQLEKGIPNVYVAGSPLSTQSKVFKGRRDIFRALERELVSHADQRPALLLFGARRMGKTSVLRQLPNAIGPQVIPVMVDLQIATLSDNVTDLLGKIVEATRNSALTNRFITLTGISQSALEQDPYRAFSDWIGKAVQSIGDRWILLCLDEYEYLEKLLSDGRVDERAFQLLRALIQNYPRITLLFSGAHTLEDLHPIWSNHLINVRVIKINVLAEDDAKELILKPIPDFPLVYEEGALSYLLSETGCHPYLIQSTCQDLVHHLNEQNRFIAQIKDVDFALNASLKSGAGYFNDLWNGPDSSEIQRSIQLELARTKLGKMSVAHLETILRDRDYANQEIQRGLSQLLHRDILKQSVSSIQFCFEIMLRWIRKEQLNLK